MSDERVCILDYGSGNIKSVLNIFCSITSNVKVSNAERDILDATHLVLPGVGAFASSMQKIHEKLPVALIENVVLKQGKFFLGICVGMQVLANRGHEFGEHDGLGWIDGYVQKISSGKHPLPHIGWNQIACRKASSLLKGLDVVDPCFYFVHSYAFYPACSEHVIATTVYGEEFCSIIQKDNIFGVQFHPEKSQQVGVGLLRNFLSMGCQ